MLSETVIISSQGSVFDGGIGSGLGLLISASESSRSFSLVNDKYTSIIKITSNCSIENSHRLIFVAKMLMPMSKTPSKYY